MPNDDLGFIPISASNQKPDELGFVPETPEEQQSRGKEEKFSSTGQQLLTGLEGAAEAGTFGLSTGLETKLGEALNIENLKPEAVRARRETNPGVHGVGQGVGLVGSTLALPGGGAAGLLGKAGVGAAEMLGLGAAETAVAKIGAAAVKNAVESALVQSGDEVSKMFSGSQPDNAGQAVTSAIANVGLATVLGGGLGGALGAVHPLWEATAGKRIASLLGDVKGSVESSSFEPGNAMEQVLGSETGLLKANAKELNEAASRLGIKELSPGTLSKANLAQRAEGNLRNRPSLAGVAADKEAEAVFSKLNTATEDLLKYKTDLTEAQVGKQIKQGLKEGLDSELKPIEARFEKLKPELKAITIPDETKLAAIDRIANHEYVKLDPKYNALAKNLSNRIESATNLDELKTVRTLVNDELNAAFRTGGPEIKILQEAKNAINDMRTSLVDASKNAEIKATDAAYAAYKKKLKDFGVEAGLGNVNSARGMLERFGKLSDEAFAKKIFDTNDINQLGFFKQNFPKEYDLARRFKLKEIYDDSINHAMGKNGKFEVGKFLRQVGKLSPEAQNELFQGVGAQTISDARSIFEAIPGTPNSSGTSYAEAFAKMFSPSGLVQNATDAVQYAILKSLPYVNAIAETEGANEATKIATLKYMGNLDKPMDATAFKSMVGFIKETIKGENLTGKAVKGVFKSGADVIPTKLMPSEKDRTNLDKKLKDLQVNAEPLFDVGGKTAHYLPEQGMYLGEMAANAVNHLNSIRPQSPQLNPLDHHMPVSKVATATYNRALDIAEQPLIVLKDVKEGTITLNDIATLKTLYPPLYAKLSSKLYDQIIESVNNEEPIPYKTRLGLSMFLDKPLDSTMTSESIISKQATFAAGAAQTSNEKGQMQADVRAKHSMTALNKLPQSYATPEQAREASKLKT